MMQAVRTTALVIVPLAAAVSAHAGSISLAASGSPTCQTNADAACSAGDASEPDLGSGVRGLSFFTSGGFTQNLFVNSSGSTASVNMSVGDSGLMGGTIGAGILIPLSWDFNMTPISGSGTITSWSLVFELGSSAGGSQYGSGGTSGSATIGSSGSTIIGSGAFLDVSQNIPSGSTLFETVLLTMNVANTNFGVQVTVPNATSWDFNSVAAVSAPEPATTGLLGAGLAFLGALVGRRRKQ